VPCADPLLQPCTLHKAAVTFTQAANLAGVYGGARFRISLSEDIVSFSDNDVIQITVPKALEFYPWSCLISAGWTMLRRGIRLKQNDWKCFGRADHEMNLRYLTNRHLNFLSVIMAQHKVGSIRGAKMDSFIKDWARWSVGERYTAIAIVAASVIGLASHFLFEMI
jgi:hypothetical protein